MSLINTVLGTPLGWLMWLCYRVTGGYVVAIVLFTLLTKIILIPLNIVVQKNSIKMVRMQPELNRINLKYFGDRDAIADRSIELYQREGYHPMLGVIPLLIQILLVLGMIQVIYHPMQHVLHVPAETCRMLVDATASMMGVPNLGVGGELITIHSLYDPKNLVFFRNCLSALSETEFQGLLTAARGLDMRLFQLDLALVPHPLPITPMLWVPVLSCASTFLLCAVQNRINVLQREQSFLGRWGAGLFTVAFSTWFTFLVPAGVGVYWIVSNILSLPSMFLMNVIYPPEKEIDYRDLAETQEKLEARKKSQKDARRRMRPYRKREKQDYRRFLKSKEKKQFVVYSESNGFYKYYSGMLDYILEHSSIVIHYITSDPNDNVFNMESPRFHAYYIGDLQLIPLMMKMDADMVLMTMPDLELYHIKRSLVRKDIEYVYMEHGCGSDNLLGKPHCCDHYDTMFNVGPHHTAEDRAMEELYQIKPRRLVKVGYGLIDDMTAAWEKMPKKPPEARKTVLIAPSWQTDNIMDSCVDTLVEQILTLDVKLIVRPHPQYIRLYPDRIEAFVARHQQEFGPDFEFQTDFSSNETVYSADLLITDWSNISMEFAFSTLKPVLYINTPMKVLNPEYKKIDIVPIDIWIRAEMGGQLELDELDRTGETVADLLARQSEFREVIRTVKEKALYNIGHGWEAAGRYVVSRLEPGKK